VNTLLSTLDAAIRKAAGADADIIQGCYQPPALAGLRPTIFLSVSSFEDEGALTREGSRTARAPLGTEAPGYLEHRPGRLLVHIDCVGPSHPAVLAQCAGLAPVALVALGALTAVSFGATAAKDCVLEFRDFSASLHGLVFRTEPDRDRPFSRGTIAIRLDGFLHARMERPKPRPPVRPERPVRPGTPARGPQRRDSPPATRRTLKAPRR
jgi:hypothetical protein